MHTKGDPPARPTNDTDPLVGPIARFTKLDMIEALPCRSLIDKRPFRDEFGKAIDVATRRTRGAIR
jgi:hypothetical protein